MDDALRHLKLAARSFGPHGDAVFWKRRRVSGHRFRTKAALRENELLDVSMIPTTKPPVRGFFVGDRGELSVLLRSDSEVGEDRVDVFDSVGVRAATLHLALARGARGQYHEARTRFATPLE